jgi:lipopolysaccharide export system permease protein
MRILSRYVLARFLSWFAIVLVVLTTGVLVAEMLLHLDTLTSAAEGFGQGLRFLLLKVCAYYLPLLVPIACFAATFLSLGLAARWLEITAAKAGGISPLRVALPVLAAAGVLSIATLALNETIVIRADRAFRHHESGGEGRIEFRRGSFWYHTGPYVFNVGDADPETRTLRGLQVFEMDETGRLARRIYAGLAQVHEDGLRLSDATELRFDRSSPLAPPQRRWLEELVLETGLAVDPTLLDANASTLSLANLREFILQRARDGGDVGRFVALFHSRLADPVSVFLLALLAIPFALRVEQARSLAVPALESVVLLLVFWSARSGGSLLANSGPLAAAAAHWIVLAGFGVLGTIALARVPR